MGSEAVVVPAAGPQDEPVGGSARFRRKRRAPGSVAPVSAGFGMSARRMSGAAEGRAMRLIVAKRDMCGARATSYRRGSTEAKA